MILLNGKKAQAHYLSTIKQKIEALSPKPTLAIVQIGDDPASTLYVNNKIKTAKKIGIQTQLYDLPKHVTQSKVLQLIHELNASKDCTGILVQLPLPKKLNEYEIINNIAPQKDVDGIHPFNLGQLAQGKARLIPATPLGILKLLQYYNIPYQEKHCVIVGRSQIVGRPASLLFSSKGIDCTVTLCHSKTKTLSFFTKQADLLIVAAGVPHLISIEHVKNCSIVIDVGIHRIPDISKKRGYSLVGDVNFKEVKTIVNAITPVPRGVGPMTITALMFNLIHAYQWQQEL